MAAVDARRRMVEEQLQSRGIRDARVLDVFTRLPRDVFVDAAHVERAYDDAPLAIGHGQTISQPYVVAITAEALGLGGRERVLEIGTGSGYAAAILGMLARDVHTVERLAELADIARERLNRLGLANVHVHLGDGSRGWPETAPYDAIAVAAAAPRVPRALLDQLAVGGRMIVPVGSAEQQRLVRITRRDAVRFDRDDLGDVRFVPLVGADAWPDA
jgi:protein-L-isoaspartate(D-aspartate) O-methyltransferase